MMRRMTVLFGRMPYTTIPRDRGRAGAVVVVVVSGVLLSVLVTRTDVRTVVLVPMLVLVGLCATPETVGRFENRGRYSRDGSSDVRIRSREVSIKGDRGVVASEEFRIECVAVLLTVIGADVTIMVRVVCSDSRVVADAVVVVVIVGCSVVVVCGVSDDLVTLV